MQAVPDQYPDYHFLLISPNLGAEWLFDAARIYWDRFRPTIINNFDFVRLIPSSYSIAVTVIARRDTAAQFGVELAQISEDIFYDPVVHDLFDETKQALDERARRGEPFGVPLTQPTSTGSPVFIPTPRLMPTNPPAGFVTAVPPTPAATTAPPASGTQDGEPEPIHPTPGSVVGGS